MFKFKRATKADKRARIYSEINRIECKIVDFNFGDHYDDATHRKFRKLVKKQLKLRKRFMALV